MQRISSIHFTVEPLPFVPETVMTNDATLDTPSSLLILDQTTLTSPNRVQSQEGDSYL